MILDRCLPFFHYHEVHSIQIEAPQEAVHRAVKEVTLSEVPVVRALFWLRWLPAVIVNEPAPIQGQRPILEQLLEAGFSPLADEENTELAVGVLSKPWNLTNKPVRVEGVEPFVQFQDKETAKIAMNFYIEPQKVSNTVWLTTETRIAVADPKSRRKFGAYWSVIYPGSSLIRRMWLLAIKSRAMSG
jgi:hypothetical protein